MILGVLASIGLALWMNTAQFEGLVRKRLVAELEQSTGGRVQVATFHWRLSHLEAEAGGVVIHGNEAPGEAPYARIDRLTCASACSASGARAFVSRTSISTTPQSISSPTKTALPTSRIPAALRTPPPKT